LKTPFSDRFVATKGRLIVPGGDRVDVTVSLYWANTNPLAYVIGIREPEGHQEAWEAARSLFVSADSAAARGAFVGGGDFAIGYKPRTAACVLYFKPAHLPREEWAQVDVDAAVVRQFVADTFAQTNGWNERAVLDRMVDVAIERCLSADRT
jgi:hypothetical protein